MGPTRPVIRHRGQATAELPGNDLVAVLGVVLQALAQVGNAAFETLQLHPAYLLAKVECPLHAGLQLLAELLPIAFLDCAVHSHQLAHLQLVLELIDAQGEQLRRILFIGPHEPKDFRHDPLQLSLGHLGVRMPLPTQLPGRLGEVLAQKGTNSLALLLGQAVEERPRRLVPSLAATPARSVLVGRGRRLVGRRPDTLRLSRRRFRRRIGRKR